MTCFLGGLSGFFLWTKCCILLTPTISWVHLYCIQVLGSQVFTDWSFGIQYLDTSLSLIICRKEDLGWRTWVLMISVICLKWLRHGWFSISLFMDFDFLYCSVTSSLTLWVFSYARLMLAWNVKLLLCSLDLVACIISALSCILLLVRLDLFTAWGVHRSYYTCFLCGLFCSPLCVTMLWLWPMLFRHGIRLQYRCDFQLVDFYPYLEMSCPCDPCCGGPHFSCCGWRVGFSCDRWWLFSPLWPLCLGHMCFDLLC
jgi:hypothetical protein